MGRESAAVAILGLFFLMVIGALVIVSPILFHEAEGLISSLPGYIVKLRALAQTHIAWVQDQMGDDVTGQLQTALQDNAQEVLSVGKGVVKGITSGGFAFVHFLTTLLITPIAAYYFMKEWPVVTAWVADLIPRQHIGQVSVLLQKIDRKISGFVRGQISVCMALGVFYAVALSVSGLQYGFFIGMVTGVLSIIPFVGSTFGLLSSVTVAFVQSDGDWRFMGMIAAIFVVGQFVEGNFITPRVIGNSVGLHPLWVIFALMAGGSLMGLMGMLLAVPVAASVGVLIGFAIDEYKKSRYFQSE
jgi:predicted PurR-regulated permease PerM